MKKLITSLLFVAGFFVYLSLLGNRSGAIAGVSGAPGEETCGQAGCHGVAPNQGTAVVSIEVDESISAYVPESTHKVKISIAGEQNANRNGFEIVALNANNDNIGEWIVSGDDVRTRSGNGRSYVTHTNAGSAKSAWEFDWKAPTTAAGIVTFYLAYNDANNNGGASGDAIYTKTLSLEEGGTSTAISNQLIGLEDLLVYPNPVKEQLNLKLNLSKNLQLKGTLTNTLGQRVQFLFNKNVPTGESTMQFDMANDLPTGWYYLTLSNEAGQLKSIPVMKQ